MPALEETKNTEAPGTQKTPGKRCDTKPSCHLQLWCGLRRVQHAGHGVTLVTQAWSSFCWGSAVPSH